MRRHSRQQLAIVIDIGYNSHKPAQRAYDGAPAMNQFLNDLAQAENCFLAGEMQEGAGLVWKTAYAAVKHAAQRYGLPCANEHEVFTSAKALDAVCPHPDIMHGLYLSAADLYRSQTSGEEIPDEIRWEPHEFFENLSGIRLMVKHLEGNSYADGDSDHGQRNPVC